MSLFRTLRSALLLFLVLLLPASLMAKELPTAGLVIQTKGGQQHHFTVELAISAREQERGLMFRERMAPDAGMLFLYDTPVMASFWMKNTILSLDMLFIEKDGTIANIYADAEPGNLTPIRSTKPVTGVLEINAGLASRLGIHPGDRVLHKAFGTAP